MAIELKIGEFQPGDKGQMELYLRWLTRYERKPEEESPIGLILCAGKHREMVELLDMERSGIKVSSYWTEALPKAELERKLHEAVTLARARLAAMKDEEASNVRPKRHIGNGSHEARKAPQRSSASSAVKPK